MNKEEVNEILAQEAADPERSENLEAFREITRADLFKDIIRPDFQREGGVRLKENGLNPFTKDMKTSFLDGKEIEILKEITDMAIEWARIGATTFAVDRLIGRETWLALAPSKNAALLRLMNTEYGIKQIRFESPKKSIFGRGQPGGDMNG